ncbi:MAG: hypothetical protein JWO20_3275 [Candidatus Angelobacter sp.]|jgi:hypothetical protein|nr:hypothetical protein [Candidatus Angelobacter sp.]
MSDPAEILQRLYVAGFDLHTFERFPNMLGVSRGEVMAMLQPSAQGFLLLGAPGWKMGDAIGVLTTKDGRKVFQNKTEIVDATPERVAAVEEFRAELNVLLAGKPS